ncbi:MAG: HAMP domain-containing histidine kinase [Lachnospiraceae bacterium]|nr:HAMP domain-containing histidine kinase [Lachnospiraceae bacterium]
MKNMKRLKPRFMRHFIPFLIAALIIAGIVSWFVYGMVRKHYNEYARRHALMFDLEPWKAADSNEITGDRIGDRYNYRQLDFLASEYLAMKDHLPEADKNFFEDATKLVDRLSFDSTVYYSFRINGDELFSTAGGGTILVNGEDGMLRRYQLDPMCEFTRWYEESDEVVKNGTPEGFRKLFAWMKSGQKPAYGFSEEINLHRKRTAEEIHKGANYQYEFIDTYNWYENIDHTESMFDDMLESDLCVVHAYDIYVIGNEYIPGKVGLFDPEGNLVRVYDFTPENAWNYGEHIIAGEEVQFLDVYNFFDGYYDFLGTNGILRQLLYRNHPNYFDGGTPQSIRGGNIPSQDQIASEYKEYRNAGWEFSYDYLATPIMFRIYPGRMVAMVGGIFLLFIGIAAWIAEQRYKSAKAAYQLVEYRIKVSNAMAHDLKTPLATLSAYAENLKEEQDPEKMREYADSILTTVGSANHLVEDILNFSRSEADNIKICKEEVNLRELILACIEEHKNGFLANGIEITTDGSDVMLHTDRKILVQAINNLVLNCAKHSMKGRTEVKWDKKSLTISNPTDLEISDVNELKKPFVKGADSRNTGGTGLGLAIADNNLEMLGYEMKLSIEDHRFIVTVNF